MCGIAGIRRFDGAPADGEMLRRMCAALAHRGPDDHGLILHAGVGLGHRRLSIIDVAGSRQPMRNATGDRFLTFNGEILNYRELRAALQYPFETSGDTETLLALFDLDGPEGVRRLRGQFAYAIFDARHDELWLYRDQLGILPLFYYQDDSVFLFASEIKAIIAALGRPPQVDRASVGDYLARRSVPAPWTLFEGIRKLPAGCMLKVGPEANTPHPTPFWSLKPNMVGSVPKDPTAAADALEARLRQAVERNLVADVPVGAYLSGGLDSGLIVSVMRSLIQGQSFHTFSASFGDPRHDESPYAELVSAQNATHHHHVRVDPHDFMRLWPHLSRHRDAPISEASDVAVFKLAELASKHVKVVLSGEGGDEIFGGYPKHQLAGLTRGVGILPQPARQLAFGSVERRLPTGLSRIRIALRALAAEQEYDRIEAWFAPFTQPERERLLEGSDGHTRGPHISTGDDPLTRMLMVDIDGWLPDNLLERGDRMTMAASVELRPPFLDLDMVNWAFSLDSSLKVRHRKGKWILRQVARRYLPRVIVERPKVGFRVPLDAWFRGDLKNLVRRALLSDESYVADHMNRTAVQELVDRHLSGKANEELRIWTLLSLEVWHRVTYQGNLEQLHLGLTAHEAAATGDLRA
jgi:asparagine synthase (glutamine-hydrolysing)